LQLYRMTDHVETWSPPYVRCEDIVASVRPRFCRYESMRVFGVVGLLAGLVLTAVLATTQLGGGPSPSPTVSIDRAVFTAADVSLAEYRAGSGTFVGAPSPQGVTLVRADTASYCVQAVQGALVQHEVGPGGPVQTGPC